MSLALALHAVAAIFWVGGMLFAHLFLRPAAAALGAPERLGLWRRVFARFFPSVWLAIGLLLVSGYWMVFRGFGGFRGLGLHINLMQGLGLLMMALFAHLYFAPYRRFCRLVDAGDFPAAAAALAQIRRIVGINMLLGAVVVAVAASGRYWA